MNCGWKVICDFVGKPVPNVEYPHKNKSGTGGQINQSMMKRTADIYENHYKWFWLKVGLLASLGTAVFIKKKLGN